MHVGLGLNMGVGLGMGRLSETFSPFLQAGDPTLLEDVDFRDGLNSGILTGWTQRGTGHTYDSRGFYAAAGGLRLENGSLSTALASSGSIILEVERSGIAFNDADKDSTDFIDLGLYNPGGGYPTPRTADTGTPYLFYSHENSAFAEERILWMNTASATASSFNWTDDRASTLTMARVADRVPSFLDPKYATVILTWNGATEYLIVDGLVVGTQTTSVQNSNRFNRIELCGGGDVASRWWGAYAIRRLQITTTSLAPVTSALRLGIIGDSFVVAATNRDSTWETGVGTEAQITSAQTDLVINAARSVRINSELGNGGWGWWLQSLAYLRNRERVWFKIFNAGDSGNGWRGDLGAGHTFGDGAKDALANWDTNGPDVIFAFGSVNDLNRADTTHTIAADIETYLEDLASRCSSLQRIVWFDTFFTPESYKTNDTAAAYAEVAAQRAAFATLNPTLVNGSAQPVEFVRVDTWAQWAPSGTQPLEYAIGSHPSNATATARTTTVDGDVHPTTEGYKRMAEIVWPYLKSLALSAAIAIPLTVSTDKVVLAGTQPRDFHVRPSVVEVDATAATFNGTRLLLADADRTNALTITGGTFVNLSVPFNQQGAWCIGPIRDQNLRDYGDITLDGCYFENIDSQCFHAFGGGTSGFEAMEWGAITFTDCVARNIGRETFYVKGPQTGNITATNCEIGTLDTRTGWSSNHTAFAGDGLDFSNAKAASWAATILIQDCTLTNLDGYGIVASSNNVTILNTTIDHCHDPAPGATNLHSVLHDPYGPTSSFAMSGCTIRTAKTNGGVNLGGASGISGTAVISSTTFEVNGDHITTSGRLGLTEVSNTVSGFSGTDPKT